MADSHAPIVIGGAALLSAFSGVVGPLVAEWTLVMGAAIIGAAALASETKTLTLREVWRIMVKSVAFALLFSAVLAIAAAKFLGVSPHELLIPVAGLLAYRQDRVIALVAKLLPIKRGTP